MRHSKSKNPVITPATAQQHEALFVKLQGFSRAVQALAQRHPEGFVPEAMRIAGEGYLFDVLKMVRPRRRSKLPVAAPAYAGLALQLAEGMAELEQFENVWSFWASDLNCRVWRVDPRGDPLPIARLHQKSLGTPARGPESRLTDEIHDKFFRTVETLYDWGFADGVSAAGGDPKILGQSHYVVERRHYYRLRSQRVMEG